jgi:metal-dependent HD superfamily phosphatase/phosphodiesterase
VAVIDLPVTDDTNETDTGVTGGEELRTYEPDEHHSFPDERLNDVLAFVEDDEAIETYLDAQNVNPVDRMQYNDHGTKHIEIVRHAALCLYELLKRGGVAFDGARQQGLDEADEPVIIALAAVLHDIGHVVHRDSHPYYSIPLAADLLDRVLPEFYDTADSVRMKGEILHAILGHDVDERPLTLEAGVVRVADGLDMERGRSRVPYEQGGRGINTVSSQAIERVRLLEGDRTPVLIEIEMTNAAGVYQIDDLLSSKVAHSGLDAHLQIVAANIDAGGDQIVERLEL